MAIERRALTFFEKEKLCEERFDASGPFWHLYTDGTRMQNVFVTKDLFEIGLAALGVSCRLVPQVKLVSFELMVNHLHLIMTGQREDCCLLFEMFKDRLIRIFSRNDVVVDLTDFNPHIIPIPDLKALRNEILYTHRNAYVANPDFTPYNYPWGTGWAYFSPLVDKIQTFDLNEISLTAARKITHTRDLAFVRGLRCSENRIFIPSFCDIQLGESMFADPRSYFNALTKNVEAFAQIAARLQDLIFLTDDELFSVACKMSEDSCQTKKITLLSPEHKIAIAKELHFKYNATNQQIRRILKLDPTILNELFPGG